jgi:hypothetical protein
MINAVRRWMNGTDITEREAGVAMIGSFIAAFITIGVAVFLEAVLK